MRHCLGITLAIKKGQLGPMVDWIGATFTVLPDGVEATITAARITELREMARSIRFGSNVVAVPLLRTFTGKAQSMASLLWVWRPFVHMLYAVLADSAQGGAPPNCRWVSQLMVPLDWLLAFLDSVSGNLVRRITLDSYLRKGLGECPGSNPKERKLSTISSNIRRFPPGNAVACWTTLFVALGCGLVHSPRIW